MQFCQIFDFTVNDKSSSFCFFTCSVHGDATWFTGLDSILTPQLCTGASVAWFLLTLAEFQAWVRGQSNMQALVFRFLFRTTNAQELPCFWQLHVVASLLPSTWIPAPAMQSTIDPWIQVPSDFSSFCSPICQSPACPPEVAPRGSVG